MTSEPQRAALLGQRPPPSGHEIRKRARICAELFFKDALVAIVEMNFFNSGSRKIVEAHKFGKRRWVSPRECVTPKTSDFLLSIELGDVL